MRALLPRVALGISRHPIRIIVESGVAFAALWTLLEPIVAFLQVNVTGWPKFVALVFAALIVGIWRALPADEQTVALPGSTTKLTIKYGDILAERGMIAVPVNEYFDSAIGAHISPHSVHGQVIASTFGGDSRVFDNAVDAALVGVPFESVSRSSGRSRRYAAGTTAYLQAGQPSVLAFVLTTTDLSTLKVSADLPQMWEALRGLWQAARVHCNDRPLAVPLVGGGLSGVGLSAQQLLSTLVMSLAAETRQKRICGHIHVCLLPSVRSETNIEAALQLLR